ncbi:9817_t:CDS:1 [Funneliformis geosporum]|uniref:18894_t:CDS:1 n=1 Tax=Funneliformis geosporum TaxID=1117311 RepID=A0A9W4SR78_9GLOM|nr:18894_t:CDS:1 [Funneliformis geosporum]CAI2178914.1 9817_t:CDS:1 [Funneliformis geosporum]
MATQDLQIVAQLLQQEQDFQFLTFDSNVALDLGLVIVKIAQQKGLPIVISISLNGHLLFHYSMPGTSPADVELAKKKSNVVNQFRHSSLYVGETLSQQKKIGDIHFVEEKEYVAQGGAFPLIVKGVGVVGSITVSGLTHTEDHEMVIGCLKEFFGKEGKNKVE